MKFDCTTGFLVEFRCPEGSGKGASQFAVTVEERPEKIVTGLKTAA